ncbi:hypothetical protein Cme02nite_55600 [Catellatospora methionotrophica]|uniref:PLD phosphodiesterase domain-containing protein n=1 Tax=Catellatospora methionotrophica TaxID=121620 RepID=A0A8J3LA98_9ACTN|nr:phosphatidylserine/phosphatidylglycerophosphate/cardiolipin synthase family protein [Catellatospora methionotrophica]GIG17228.1 hypothetical protein Cme02nite_55600 [Catellatospora methionotrophica]
MIQLVADDVWPGLADHLGTEARTVAAIAYVGAAAADLLQLEPGDSVIVDGSDRVVSAGGVDPEVISTWLDQGVDVRSLPGLHAKVMLVESEPPVGIVGSANASANSRNLFEAAIVTTDNGLCDQLKEQLDVWWTRSDEVDARWLAHARAIYQPPRSGPGRRSPGSKAAAAGPIWLGKTTPSDYDLGPKAEAELSRLTARYGEGMVETWQLYDDDEDRLLRGHEVVLFEVSVEGGEPHGNTAASAPAVVARVIVDPGSSPVALLVRTDDTYAQQGIRFGRVRQALWDVGAEVGWDEPYAANSAAAEAIRGLWIPRLRNPQA